MWECWVLDDLANFIFILFNLPVNIGHPYDFHWKFGIITADSVMKS